MSQNLAGKPFGLCMFIDKQCHLQCFQDFSLMSLRPPEGGGGVCGLQLEFLFKQIPILLNLCQQKCRLSHIMLKFQHKLCYFHIWLTFLKFTTSLCSLKNTLNYVKSFQTLVHSTNFPMLELFAAGHHCLT